MKPFPAKGEREKGENREGGNCRRERQRENCISSVEKGVYGKRGGNGEFWGGMGRVARDSGTRNDRSKSFLRPLKLPILTTQNSIPGASFPPL